MKDRYLALVGLMVALAALGWVMGVYQPSRDEQTTSAYLDRQASAMQPAFRGDLQALAQAPRYTIEADVAPDTGHVSGQMTVTYANQTGVTLSDLVFRLYPNATSVYGGGSLTVGEVTRDGTAVDVVQADDNTVLRVPLEPALEPGASVSVRITFTARVPYWSGRGYGIYNRARGVLSLAGWYPVLVRHAGGWRTPPIVPVWDAMVAEIGLYEVSLTIPAGYQVASTGALLDQQSAEGQTTVRLVSGPAREFAAAISNRFEVRTLQSGGVTIRLFTLPFRSPVTPAEQALEDAAQAFAIYTERFGPYPFNELDVVDVAVSIGGYEFPGMVYVEARKRAYASASQYGYLMAHEIAHQWWYGLVGARPIVEPWLDEAFATYAVALYRERTQGSAARESLVAYWGRTATSRPVDSPVSDFGGWGGYRGTVYERGALFLENLRQEMGDEQFFTLLHRYQTRMRYRVGTTETFLAMAEEIAGRDLSSFFTPWFGARDGG